jgi:hypothetical protein
LLVKLHARILGIMMALGAASAAAQGGWERINPPDDAAVDWLTQDASGIITVTGGGGTFHTSDAGKTWTGGNDSAFPVTMKLNGAEVSATTRYSFDADANGDLYTVQGFVLNAPAFKLGLTLFKSTDHGATWNSVIDSLPGGANGYDTKLYIAPNGNFHLLFSTVSSELNALMVSKDKGRHWEAAGGLKFYSLFAIAPDGRLYAVGGKAGASRQTLYRSTNDGATFDSLYFPGADFHAIAANRKGAVAVSLGNAAAAVLPPGESVFKKAAFVLGAGPSSALAITPDDKVLLGVQSNGIQLCDSALESTTSMNAGLGVDTGSAPHLLRYDAQENLYLLVGRNLYVMRAKPSAAGPRGRGDGRLRGPAAPEEFDLEGRRIRASRPAATWLAPAPTGRRSGSAAGN